MRANRSYIDLLSTRLLLLSSYVDLLPSRYHLVQYTHLLKQRSVVLPQEWDSNLGPLLVLLLRLILRFCRST